jgi:hypothetical protein
MISKSHNRNWAHEVELSSTNKRNLKYFISEERNYFNRLIDGFSGPSRTMRDVLSRMIGPYEEMFGVLAAHKISLSTVTMTALPKALQPYSAILVSADGKCLIDSKMMIIYDIAALPGEILHQVRRAMAIAALGYAREQASLLSDRSDGEQSYKFAIPTLVPLDERTKRHAQVPRNALKASEDTDGMTSIEIPYLTSNLSIPTPPFKWNYISIRLDDDKTVVEVSMESAPYLLKKTDFVKRVKR